jgi:hypothetical protein
MFPVLPKTLAVDLMLNTTGDEWIRYAFNNWIIWTEKPAPEIDALVRRQLARDDQVLIIALNMEERGGSVSPWVWEWLDARKQSRNLTLNDILIQSTGLGTLQNKGLNALRNLAGNPSDDQKR